LVLDFSSGSADNATATVGAITGVARVVATELTARTIVRSNGRTSTQLVLGNPSPTLSGSSTGTISSASDSALDTAIPPSTVLTRWDDSVGGNSFVDTYGSFWQLPLEGTAAQRTGSSHSYDSNAFMTGSARQLADDRYFFNMTGDYGFLGSTRSFRVDYVFESPIAGMAPTLAEILINGTTPGTGVGDTAATAMDIGAQSLFNLSWASAADPGLLKWQIQIRKVIDPTAGNAVDTHADVRSRMRFATDLTELTHDGATTYTWDNSQTLLDLANFLNPGEVARIVIRSENADGSIRGYGASIFVTIP
jgi:hypothetical protein